MSAPGVFRHVGGDVRLTLEGMIHASTMRLAWVTRRYHPKKELI